MTSRRRGGRGSSCVMTSRVTLESSPSVRPSWMRSITEILCVLCSCAASEPREVPCTCCPVLERMHAHASKGKSRNRSRPGGLWDVSAWPCLVEVGWPKRRQNNKRDVEGRSCVYVLLHVYVQVLMHVCAGVCAYMCTRGGKRSIYIPCTLLFETGSPTGWELTEEAQLANQPQGFSCLGQAYATTPGFYLGSVVHFSWSYLAPRSCSSL